MGKDPAMLRNAWLAWTLAATIAGIGNAAAQEPDNETAGDLRCLAVSLVLTHATNADMRSAGVGGSLYFLGRLDAHAPDTHLDDSLVETVEKMSPADLTAEARHCGTMIKGRGVALNAASISMFTRAKNLQPKPSTQQTPAPAPAKPVP
jgi:hypothetical protein